MSKHTQNQTLLFLSGKSPSRHMRGWSFPISVWITPPPHYSTAKANIQSVMELQFTWSHACQLIQTLTFWLTCEQLLGRWGGGGSYDSRRQYMSLTSEINKQQQDSLGGGVSSGFRYSVTSSHHCHLVQTHKLTFALLFSVIVSHVGLNLL